MIFGFCDMVHPFQSLLTGQGKKLFLIALMLFVILQGVFVALDAPLRTAAAPNGIISFELAGNLHTARATVDSWNELARLYASFGLGVDYLFIVAYSIVLAFACVWSARVISARHLPLVGYGAILAWGIWLAALSDAIENAALLAQLFGGVSDPYPQLAAFCATLKFLLIAACVLYSSYGVAAWFSGRRWVESGV